MKPEISIAHTAMEDEPPPLRSEVEAALNQIGNGKSPGIDDIPAEMWKATGEEGLICYGISVC